MKKDPPIWKTADFECINVLVRNANCGRSLPLESANVKDYMESLFVNKPVSIGYNII